jgi:hypothetical protein
LEVTNLSSPAPRISQLPTCWRGLDCRCMGVESEDPTVVATVRAKQQQDPSNKDVKRLLSDGDGPMK